jgi:hypothetical protein
VPISTAFPGSDRGPHRRRARAVDDAPASAYVVVAAGVKTVVLLPCCVRACVRPRAQPKNSKSSPRPALDTTTMHMDQASATGTTDRPVPEYRTVPDEAVAIAFGNAATNQRAAGKPRAVTSLEKGVVSRKAARHDVRAERRRRRQPRATAHGARRDVV